MGLITYKLTQVFVVSNPITITESAQSHFAKLLAQQPEGTNIRVFVVNPGTQNAECGVSYCPPEAVESNDTEFKYEALAAYVDELSLPFLEDAGHHLGQWHVVAPYIAVRRLCLPGSKSRHR